ncbi:hypothetical protein [Nocardia transvalensis]|uniref:hypothetical protein n=1 Tax=Nocardia transvalensis TaxID=37333 RepID=UPI0018945051|nr:hypothetical protein [Nocardia transvalensis]MBF6329786.1 hypothetical protein [Nocardia transvalensis]
MTAAPEEVAGVQEWMRQAYTRIKDLHDRMDAATDPVEQQRLSDESSLVAEPWESSRFAEQWHRLWLTDSAPGAVDGAEVQAERDRLAIELDTMRAERDQLRAENTQLQADRTELAGQLTAALNERDRLQQLVHDLEVEVDDALDLVEPHVLDANHERLVTAIPRYGSASTPQRAQRAVMQQ